MPLQASITLTPEVGDDNGICEAQQPSAGGVQELDLDGALVVDGVAQLVVPTIVVITSDADDSGNTFVITGTNYQGLTQTETLVGPDTASIETSYYYLTVTSITISDDAAGSLTVGTNGQASSAWYPMNYNRYPVSSQICNLSTGADLTYTVQFTGDNLQASKTAAITAIAQDHSTLTNQTLSNTGILISGVCGVRIVSSAYTSGSVTMNIIQSSATAG